MRDNLLHYAIKGTIVAAANWRTRHNFDRWICQARWEYDGKVFYGDFQECHWANLITPRAAYRKR